MTYYILHQWQLLCKKHSFEKLVWNNVSKTTLTETQNKISHTKHKINCKLNAGLNMHARSSEDGSWNFSDQHRNCAYPINVPLKKFKYNLALLIKSFVRLSTKQIRILINVITGQINLKSQLYSSMNIALNPLCKYCDLQNIGTAYFLPRKICNAHCPRSPLQKLWSTKHWHRAYSLPRKRCNAHTRKLPSIHDPRFEFHFEDFRINLEDIINQKHPLTITLQRIIK